MKLAALALALMQPFIPATPWTSPDVLKTMEKCWLDTSLGYRNVEAAFILNGGPENYSIEYTPSDNQRLHVRVGIHPGFTFALFHVHPNGGDPQPSEQDRAVADKYNLLMYTFSRDGIFLYDPGTRKITHLTWNRVWTGEKP